MKESGKIVLKRLEELIRADRLIVAQKILDEVSWYSIHSSLQGTFYRLTRKLAINRKEDFETIEVFEQGIIYTDTQDMDVGIDYRLAHCYTNVPVLSRNRVMNRVLGIAPIELAATYYVLNKEEKRRNCVNSTWDCLITTVC